MDMEARLQKIHDIDVVHRRGLKIEEEEQSTSGQDSGVTFLNNYERQRSVKPFLDPKVKYHRFISSIILEKVEDKGA